MSDETPNPEYEKVDVRRIMAFLEKACEEACSKFLFEPESAAQTELLRQETIAFWESMKNKLPTLTFALRDTPNGPIVDVSFTPIRPIPYYVLKDEDLEKFGLTVKDVLIALEEENDTKPTAD